MASAFRIGIGYDIHHIVRDRPLWLGGVKVSGEFGLGGHTDGDVVIHAVIDAMLGAAGMKDIGEQFPSSDPELADAASSQLLAQTFAKVAGCGYDITNIDVTIVAEVPQLQAHKAAMRLTLADLLHLDVDCVSVKAKTNEKLDAVGRREAIACHAAILLQRKD